MDTFESLELRVKTAEKIESQDFALKIGKERLLMAVEEQRTVGTAMWCKRFAGTERLNSINLVCRLVWVEAARALGVETFDLFELIQKIRSARLQSLWIIERLTGHRLDLGAAESARRARDVNSLALFSKLRWLEIRWAALLLNFEVAERSLCTWPAHSTSISDRKSQQACSL